MTCLNIGCPLGMGIWEGVPLREVLWLTRAARELRRVFYYGYHNDDPKQMFQARCLSAACWKIRTICRRSFCVTSSTASGSTADAAGRCGWSCPKRTASSRSSGSRTSCSRNLAHANDTYANGNNDVDSPLKTFAATLSVPEQVAAGQPIPDYRLCAGRHFRIIESAGVDQPAESGVASRR